MLTKYCSGDKMDFTLANMAVRIVAFVGKPEGNSPLVRPSGKGDDVINMDKQKVGWGMACFDVVRIGTCNGHL
jgi:hypothetical protein